MQEAEVQSEKIQLQILSSAMSAMSERCVTKDDFNRELDMIHSEHQDTIKNNYSVYRTILSHFTKQFSIIQEATRGKH